MLSLPYLIAQIYKFLSVLSYRYLNFFALFTDCPSPVKKMVGPKFTSQFHRTQAGRCCQICGEFMYRPAAHGALLDEQLKEVFPELTARGLASRPSRLTCSACFAKATFRPWIVPIFFVQNRKALSWAAFILPGCKKFCMRIRISLFYISCLSGSEMFICLGNITTPQPEFKLNCWTCRRFFI